MSGLAEEAVVTPATRVLEQVLEQVFPFHLEVDDGGRAVRIGPSLALVRPDLLPGSLVDAHLRIVSPRGARWGDVPPGLVIVEAVGSALVLRGQMIAAPGGALLLGSPWVTTLAHLDELGLRLVDFAAADPVTDFVMLLGAQASALADATTLAAQLKQTAVDLRHRASHDSLTGLANRTRLTEVLGEHLRAGTGVGVVLLDLIHFKEINEILGHRVGDRLLQLIGERVVETVGERGLTARMVGDEFGVLLPTVQPGCALAEHLEVVGQVLRALEQPFLVDDVTVALEASAGFARAPEDGVAAETLLRRAETAMHRAKAEQRPVVVYEPGVDGNDPRRLRLLAELREAIELDQLVLHYQPLLDLRSGRVLAVEALVRWQHPVDGLLPPGRFIPLAEGSGTIHRLTRAVITKACRQAKAWQDAGWPVVVAVNVSARSLIDGSLPDVVVADLRAVGLPPQLLRIEITESAIIADPVRARDVLMRLRELGVGLAIDDFGSGYTSLAHLRDLPVHELKIDSSFVTTMLTEPRNLVIVRTGIELAARFGLESVAEGIEDGETLAALRRLGCTTAQGYHVARPMAVEALDAWRRHAGR